MLQVSFVESLQERLNADCEFRIGERERRAGKGGIEEPVQFSGLRCPGGILRRGSGGEEGPQLIPDGLHMAAQGGAMGGEDRVDDGAFGSGETCVRREEFGKRGESVGADGDRVAIVKNGVGKGFDGSGAAEAVEQLGMKQLGPQRLCGSRRRGGGGDGRNGVDVLEFDARLDRERGGDGLAAARIEAVRPDEGLGGRRDDDDGFAEIGTEFVEDLRGANLERKRGEGGFGDLSLIHI